VEKVNNVLGSMVTRQRATGLSIPSPQVSPEAQETLAAGAMNTDGLSRDTLGHKGSTREYYPRRKRTGPATDLTRIKGILSRVLAHRGLDKKVERYEFILHWRSIVGERLAEVTKPDCIRNKTLFVNVVHSVWAQELTFMKPMLLQKLSHYLKPGDIVTDMVFRIGQIEGR
jgi:predicted nucleic acid-binding Zn ribbon protein